MMLELNYRFGCSIGGEGNGDLFRFVSLDKNKFLAVYDRPHCRFHQASGYIQHAHVVTRFLFKEIRLCPIASSKFSVVFFPEW